MIIYNSNKNTFMKYVEKGIISNIVYDAFRKKLGEVSISEQLSWRNSLRHMYNVLNTPTIPDDSGIAIEYRLPYTSKRVDFIISGKNTDNSEHAMIVELKQWQEAKTVKGKNSIVKTYVGNAEREVTHPSYQAWSYSKTLQEYNKIVQEENITLHPCAFLHNYLIVGKDPIIDEEFFEIIREAPIFTQADAKKLRSFIAKYIKKSDDNSIIFRIDGGKIKPSKSLQDSLASMLSGNQEFIMIESQKIIYEDIMYTVNHLKNDTQGKKVFIIKGGPGTGKSVLAINLLSDIISEGKLAVYVTKNSAPRNVYFEKLRQGNYRKNYVHELFKGSGSFTDSETNDFEVLLVDEAHRLNEKSGLYSNIGENQIKEIINAARLSVFFIDEDQRVTSKDIGTIEQIKYFAKQQHAKIIEAELDSQFRCNGSDGYIAWLSDVLEIRRTANDIFNNDNYTFKIFDDPNEMRDAIIKENKYHNKARLLAGYCWNWESKNHPSKYDIIFPEHHFKAQWNFSNTTTWAIDTDSVEQIGCIHTSQGLEFDYIGVIIGDDLRFENGHIITDFSKRARTDQSLKGFVTKCRKGDKVALKFADTIIRNTYKTLLSRGMKGCFVYCTDQALSNYFKERLKRNNDIYNEITYTVQEAAETAENLLIYKTKK